MKTIEQVIQEIWKFSTKVLSLADGVTQDGIKAFEEKHGLNLPQDYKIFLQKTNGLTLMGSTVYGIFDDSRPMSLGWAYNIEHHEVDNEMPVHLIPFSPDGWGNHYCFDSIRCDDDSCKVVFWQYDLSYSEENPPKTVNDSFAEWAQEVLVDWILEDYDYEGNENT